MKTIAQYKMYMKGTYESKQFGTATIRKVLQSLKRKCMLWKNEEFGN